MQFRRLLPLLPALASALILSACSIEDESSEEITIEQETAVIVTPADEFIALAGRCVAGDTAVIPELAAMYRSSYEDESFQPYLLYQTIEPTRAFEACGKTELMLGSNEIMQASLMQPEDAAAIARGFYIRNDERNGAFWLQRLINLRGEKDGYYLAGEHFIHHPGSLAVGARMLAYAVDLGSIEAGELLRALTTPGTSAFEEITAPDFMRQRSTGAGCGLAASGRSVSCQRCPLI